MEDHWMHRTDSRIAGYLLVASVLAILFIGCASHVRKESVPVKILTEKQLVTINDENRFTKFYYSDGKILSGIMLRWTPDSVHIQPRGAISPIAIPTDGLAKIETITGNKMFTGLTIGSAVAAAYFIVVKGYSLRNVTFFEGISKLLVPPAIILTAMGIGASKNTLETYLIPIDFKFDYDISKSRFQTRK